jgi:hypothetical protein
MKRGHRRDGMLSASWVDSFGARYMQAREGVVIPAIAVNSNVREILVNSEIATTCNPSADDWRTDVFNKNR